MQASDSTHDGQAVYSRAVLNIYDVLVLGLSCTAVWQCTAEQLLAHYQAHVRGVHLDVGVGTGYFLDRVRFPTPEPELTLFDLNENSLVHAAQRVARYRPRQVQGDVLSPNDLPEQHFESIGLSFLLHCLPASVSGPGKWRCFDYLKPKLKPGGVLFGSTILGQPEPALRRQRWLMGVYNRKGIFGNARDDRATLERELQSRFRHVDISTRGVVALFSATV
ncbi:MAG TPA: class I SAM-dependent methyltransferase [Polyangiaceae bacterium]|nr:class I SAM-dependent methyltransferase [Polyangiaceae bacterium]